MKWRYGTRHSLLCACVLSCATILFAQPSGTGTATVVARAVIAASCSQAHVQAAVDAATAGDTVLVPAGSCTWSTPVSISKAVHLRGAGTATTIAASSTGAVIVYVSASNVEISRVAVTGGGQIQITAGSDWRMHHMSFTGAAAFSAIYVRGNSKTTMSRGLVDSNVFANGRVLIHGYPGAGASENNGNTHWYSALGLGTAEAVYVEDNTFTFTVFYNAFDCEYSGRIVFRHNTVTDAYLETHSLQGFSRACRKWEVYGNTIQQVNEEVYRPIFFRGGTGVIFDNAVTGTFGAPTIHLDNVRTLTGIGGEVGQCDGTSIWDGNAESNGYPCRDQIGRGQDVALWTTSPYPAQTAEPAYMWGNTINGDPLGVTVISGSGVDHIKPSRDYYVNVGAKPDYTPYTYPHPLRTP